jgi:signal peptidase I
MEATPNLRRPWIAALLTLAVPGLGQLYSGWPSRALAIFAGHVLLLMGLLWTGLPRTFAGLLIFLLAFVLVVAWDVWDAVRIARLSRENGLQAFHRGYLFVALLIATHVMLPRLIDSAPVRFFQIPGANMEPAVLPGDRVAADMTRPRTSRPRRGELVLYGTPDEPDPRLCRVIGLPGEQIEIREKVVHIQGKPLTDPWGRLTDGTLQADPGSPRDNLPPVEIPADAVFLLGDNRDFSYDSRFFGPVPLSNIGGRPLYIYWAADRSRIGTSLR